MGRHKNTPEKGRPTEPITVILPQSVTNALEILAKRNGWKMVQIIEEVMVSWIETLTKADIADPRFTKASGVPFPKRNGDLLHGKGHPFVSSEDMFRYPMKLHADTLDKVGDISYWRGMYRADVMREAIAYYIGTHDPEGTWADWYFERGSMVIPRNLKTVATQQEAFRGKKLARGSIQLADFGNPETRPHGDGNP